ncbi:unnamed protein product [Effrenium voratum]|nr:unnamed protein product [Effrenium voratum]
MAEVLLSSEKIQNGWSRFEDYMGSFDQGTLSLVFGVLGVALLARGFAVMKPGFVLSLSAALAGRTCAVAITEGSGFTGGVSSLVVFACGIVFCHRIYGLFVFLLGAALGGAVTFIFRAALGLTNTPVALIGFILLVSVFSGLVLQNFRLLSYRVLTPVVGGLLAAATLRYWVVALFATGAVQWLSFTHYPLNPAYVVTDPLEVFFVVAWGFGCCLGWYSQLIAILAGQDPLALPDHVALAVLKFGKYCPWIFDGGEEFSNKIFPQSLLKEKEPFLPKAEEEKEEGPADYRPECMIFLSALSVLLLNFFMIGRPLLFLGHVVMMSMAFQVFMTASLASYASPKRVLPGLSGGPLVRHFSHASLNGLVLLFSIGGFLSMYARHLSTETDQMGLNSSLLGKLHIWTGYASLAMLFIMAFSGAAKMFAGPKMQPTWRLR